MVSGQTVIAASSCSGVRTRRCSPAVLRYAALERNHRSIQCFGDIVHDDRWLLALQRLQLRYGLPPKIIQKRTRHERITFNHSLNAGQGVRRVTQTAKLVAKQLRRCGIFIEGANASSDSTRARTPDLSSDQSTTRGSPTRAVTNTFTGCLWTALWRL